MNVIAKMLQRPARVVASKSGLHRHIRAERASLDWPPILRGDIDLRRGPEQFPRSPWRDHPWHGWVALALFGGWLLGLVVLAVRG